MSSRLRGWLLGGAVCVSLAAACIIPDARIDVDRNFRNEHPVRLVAPILVAPAVDDACAEIDDQDDLEACPPVPPGLPTGLVAGNFCSCPEGQRDGRAALRFDVFVEDADVDDAGDPRDDVLGVFLLDVPPGTTDPTAYVAYRNFLPPDQPAERAAGREAPTIERADPNLRSWTIGVEEVDLCNDNGGQKLDPGLHELRLVVTDRPWFRPYVLDDDGEFVEDDEGTRVRGEPIFGVPDLPAGASYDSRAFVFRCGAQPDDDCLCVTQEAP